MKATVFLILLGILPTAACQQPPCHGKPVNTESAVLQILETSTPSEVEAGRKDCITAAIDYAEYLRSQPSIPQLIRYLSFHKDRTEMEEAGLQTPIEGGDYPAVLALARIGRPARAALLEVVQSASASAIERQNATHAIVLSYIYPPDLTEKEHDPGNGILYLRNAEIRADSGARNRIDEMISYALKTQACVRYAPKCTDAKKARLPKQTE